MVFFCPAPAIEKAEQSGSGQQAQQMSGQLGQINTIPNKTINQEIDEFVALVAISTKIR